MARRNEIVERCHQEVVKFGVAANAVMVEATGSGHRQLIFQFNGGVRKITVPNTASDHRSLLNNVTMTRRLMRRWAGMIG